MLTKYTIQFENRSKTKNVQAYYVVNASHIASSGMYLNIGIFSNTFCRTLDEPLIKTSDLIVLITKHNYHEYGGHKPTYAEFEALCTLKDAEYQQTIDLLKRLSDWTFPDAP